MAGKRAVINAIEWSKIAERVPEVDLPKFAAFRAKSDGYLRRMNSNPEAPPKLDWDFYKKTVPVPGMVDTFQKQYESLTIPYPSDNISQLIDQQEKQVKADLEQFKIRSEGQVKAHQEEIDRIHGLIPYGQMTMEDFRDAHPDLALDPINRPTLWPHTPDSQGDDEPPKGGH